GNTVHLSFSIQVAWWLWFPLLFAKFAESMAAGRGKAQADTLRKAKTETVAHLIVKDACGDNLANIETQEVSAPKLKKGDLVLVRAGEFIPGDGEVVEGVASVDESAITGERVRK